MFIASAPDIQICKEDKVVFSQYLNKTWWECFLNTFRLVYKNSVRCCVVNHCSEIIYVIYIVKFKMGLYNIGRYQRVQKKSIQT